MQFYQYYHTQITFKSSLGNVEWYDDIKKTVRDSTKLVRCVYTANCAFKRNKILRQHYARFTQLEHWYALPRAWCSIWKMLSVCLIKGNKQLQEKPSLFMARLGPGIKFLVYLANQQLVHCTHPSGATAGVDCQWFSLSKPS